MTCGSKGRQGRAGKALHVISNMVVALVLCANLAVILLMLSCGLCSYISPATAPLLGLFCLTYPIYVVADMAFIPVWLLIRWRMAIVPVAGLLLSAAFTQSYCPIHPLGVDDVQEGARTLRVMTFNSHMFTGIELEGGDTAYTLLKLLRRDTFDIIVVQEGEFGGRKREVLDDFMPKHGYTLVQSDDAQFRSNIIYTRLTPIDIAPAAMPTGKSNRTVTCRLLLGDDTLTVVNAHLESYQLKEPVKEQYRDALHQLNPDSTKNTGRFVMQLMKPAMSLHGEQIDSLMTIVEPLVKRGSLVMLCGDFNDSPVSYACRRARSCLTDAYREAGWGPGFTYHDKAMPFRIDHIFVSDRLRPVKTWVESSVLESDHYPLATILEVLPKKADGEE